ncbi:TPA: O-antigen translocase [Aeromonas veronii]
MKLWSTTLLGAFSTLLRMISGLIISKFIAVYAGPTGLAMLGQLQSFVAGINGLIANQIGQGIVRFTAEANKSSDYYLCKEWWSAATSLLTLSVSSSLVLCILFSHSISSWLFDSEVYYWVILIVAFSLPLNALNTALLSALNGLGLNVKNITAGMVSVILSGLLAVFLLYQWGFKGGLISIAINNGIAAFVVLFFVAREPWFKFKLWFSYVDKEKRVQLSKYLFVGIIGAMTGPTALIVVRNIITDLLSSDSAGLWQSVSKISDAYLSMLTVGIGLYYFPKAAAINNISLLRLETIKVLKFTVPVLLLSSLFIYYFRDDVLIILFSKDFSNAHELFLGQQIGDIFRVMAFVPGCLLLAKGYFKVNICVEVIINLSFVLLSKIFIPLFGLVGVNYAYAINYFILMIFMYSFFKWHCDNYILNEKKNEG